MSIYTTKKELQEVISSIPLSVEQAYEQILSKVEQRYAERARKLLMIVVAATQPMNLREMNTALAMGEESSKEKELELIPESKFGSVVKSICGLFVSVVDAKIYLMHHTAREFLLSKYGSGAKVSSTSSWQSSMTLSQSHLLLADICLRYLFLVEFSQKPYPNLWSGFSGVTTAKKVLVAEYRLLDYAARHWPFHFRESNPSVQSPLFSLAVNLCDAQLNRFWLLEYWHEGMRSDFGLKSPESLTVASALGLEGVVSHMLGEGTRMETTKGAGLSPLSTAVQLGHASVVAALLQKIDNLDWQLPENQSLLRLAASRGFTPVVEMLVQAGCDMEGADSAKRTPLICACQNFQYRVVEYLVSRGANILVNDYYENSPLKIALSGPDEKLLSILSTQPSATFASFRTPASVLELLQDKNFRMIDFLLKKGLDLNDSLPDTSVPLTYALACGDRNMISFLTRRGADTNVRASDGWTPLTRSADAGDEFVVKLLLKHQVKLDLRNGESQTPLMLAVSRGHSKIVHLLLDRGADMTLYDDRGLNSLALAAISGHKPLVSLLLLHGANANRENQGPMLCLPLNRRATILHEHLVNMMLTSNHIGLALESDHLFSCHVCISQDLDDDLEAKRAIMETKWSQGSRLREIDLLVQSLLLAGAGIKVIDWNGKHACWQLAGQVDHAALSLMRNKACHNCVSNPDASPLLNARLSTATTIILPKRHTDAKTNGIYIGNTVKWRSTIVTKVLASGSDGEARYSYSDPNINDARAEPGRYQREDSDRDFSGNQDRISARDLFKKFFLWAVLNIPNKILPLTIYDEKGLLGLPSPTALHLATAVREALVQWPVVEEQVELHHSNAAVALSPFLKMGRFASLAGFLSSSDERRTKQNIIHQFSISLNLPYIDDANFRRQNSYARRDTVVRKTRNTHDSLAMTPLIQAAATGDVNMVELLLKRGADVSAEDRAGNTALIHAAVRDHQEVIEVLTHYGAKLSAQGSDNKTALYLALQSRRFEIVEALLDAGARLVKTEDSFPGLESSFQLWDSKYFLWCSEAIKGGHMGAAEALLNCCVDIGALSNAYRQILLSYAIFTRHLETARSLLQAGTEPRFEAPSGQRSLLSLATWNSRNSSGELVRLLLDHGADVNIRDKRYQITPLWVAAYVGAAKVVALLLERGADMNLEDRNGHPPYWAARGHHAVVELLLNHGRKHGVAKVEDPPIQGPPVQGSPVQDPDHNRGAIKTGKRRRSQGDGGDSRTVKRRQSF